MKITIYLTPENGEGVLTNGGRIKKAVIDDITLTYSEVIKGRYHSGYGGEGTWWHTSYNKAKKLVREAKKRKLHLLKRQMTFLRKLPIRAV